LAGLGSRELEDRGDVGTHVPFNVL
jgi:hypothetical protein